jgi:hypothetical protein
MNLLLEADRIDDRLKQYSLSESIFAAGTSNKAKRRSRKLASSAASSCGKRRERLPRQSAITTESERTFDNLDTVNEIVDTVLGSSWPMDGCTDTSISTENIMDGCLDSKKRKLCSEPHELHEAASVELENNESMDKVFVSKSYKTICSHDSPDAVMSSTSANQEIDQNIHNRNTSFKRRVYSHQKRVGSRCYAQWPGNGNFFWGFITKAIGYGPHRKYSVRTLCKYSLLSS